MLRQFTFFLPTSEIRKYLDHILKINIMQKFKDSKAFYNNTNYSQFVEKCRINFESYHAWLYKKNVFLPIYFFYSYFPNYGFLNVLNST